MMMRNWRLAVVSAFFLVIAGGLHVNGQMIQYAIGQDVAPLFDGWEQNPDGTYNMVFGYLNRNFEEEIDVPIGPNNSVDLGSGGDAGQPTHFYPRRQRYQFKVVVPKNWDKKRKVVWTLTAHGRTEQARGWLSVDWELNNGVIAANTRGVFGVDYDNKPPSVTATATQGVSPQDAVTLTASATDDGRPKPRPARPAVAGANNADAPPRREASEVLRIRWIHYRGPGKVVFDPDASTGVYGQPVTLTSKASFSAPGTYVVRAIATDGQLFGLYDVTVNVKPRDSR